ncbi:MAG: hypothetical protein NTW28_22810, partial [Candidatus Solibacter sp.]|nr:hypothetical protein [Candidatus Solibacter sp.]
VSIAWPQDLLIDVRGQVAGYVMPMVRGMGLIADYYFPKVRRAKYPLFTYHYLVATAQNLATAVRALHRRGYVMGDVNEGNILVAPTAMLTLVDTDSFQVREPGGGRVHRCRVGTLLYTPRELQEVDFAKVERGEEHDLFGLGVLLFQLLMESTHPFQARYAGPGEPPEPQMVIAAGGFPHGTGSALWQPPRHAPAFGMLDARLRGLFTRCFVNGHRDPKARPPADEWRAALVDAAAALVPCPRNASHFHWPHAKPCPWCERAAKLGGRDPFPALAQVRAGSHLSPAPKGPPPASRPQPQARPQVKPRPQPARQVQPQSRVAPQVPSWDQPAPQVQPRPQFTWLSRPGQTPVPQPRANPDLTLQLWVALAGLAAAIGATIIVIWWIFNL